MEKNLDVTLHMGDKISFSNCVTNCLGIRFNYLFIGINEIKH
jgi:hypothetical protein